MLNGVMDALVERCDPAVSLDVAIAAVGVAAMQLESTPRVVLDSLWKRMDDESFARGMLPVLRDLQGDHLGSR